MHPIGSRCSFLVSLLVPDDLSTTQAIVGAGSICIRHVNWRFHSSYQWVRSALVFLTKLLKRSPYRKTTHMRQRLEAGERRVLLHRYDRSDLAAPGFRAGPMRKNSVRISRSLVSNARAKGERSASSGRIALKILMSSREAPPRKAVMLA